MMQSIILCDHVTERGFIGLRNLVTERDLYFKFAQFLSASFYKIQTP
jgi:hypothetical protein